MDKDLLIMALMLWLGTMAYKMALKHNTQKHYNVWKKWDEFTESEKKQKGERK